jgi:hypothetical protein
MQARYFSSWLFLMAAQEMQTAVYDTQRRTKTQGSTGAYQVSQDVSEHSGIAHSVLIA